jgi:hypothetical protein
MISVNARTPQSRLIQLEAPGRFVRGAFCVSHNKNGGGNLKVQTDIIFSHPGYSVTVSTYGIRIHHFLNKLPKQYIGGVA